MLETNEDDLPLTNWNQEINFGRDLFIEINTPAEIVPFQIKCTLVHTAERHTKEGSSLLKHKYVIRPSVANLFFSALSNYLKYVRPPINFKRPTAEKLVITLIRDENTGFEIQLPSLAGVPGFAEPLSLNFNPEHFSKQPFIISPGIYGGFGFFEIAVPEKI